MRFDQLLSRADDEVLEVILGPPVVRLLNLIDPAIARPRRLRQLITSFRPPEELLRDPQARAALLDLLPPEAAKGMTAALGTEAAPDPYAALRGQRFGKGSRAERTLFNELGVVPQEVEVVDRHPAVADADAAYSLFAHQRLAAHQAQALLDAPPHRLVLHMPTGAGKTRTAMHLISTELRRHEPTLVVWLAFSEELCEQAATEFVAAWEHLGDRPTSIYRYWGERDLSIGDVDDGFMVAGLAKTYATARRSIDFIVRLADRASLVIIDEAHQAVAETYRLILEVLIDRNPGSRLLGLTATPGRTWNEPDKDRELADFFHRQKVTLQVEGYKNPVDYLIAEGYLASPTFESLFYSGSSSMSAKELAELASALDVPEAVLQRLADDEQRNLLILHRVERLLQEHSRILLFAATVGHARLLATILQARGHSASAVTATTPLAERQRVITRFKSDARVPMVLCNYGVLTAGFDAPRTSAAVIARPTKSLVLYSQMVGRATRGPRAGGNAAALIVTVVDSSLPGFGEMSDAFKNWEDVW